MLINQIWQLLLGTRQAEIYPYLRKPDLLSSNSCLIRTPEQIILIPLINIPFVRIAAARFFDTLLSFLEWLKQADPSSINIATGIDRTSPFITVMPWNRDGSSPTFHEGKKTNSFHRRFRMCGLILKMEKDGFRLTLVEDRDKRE